MEHPKKNIIFQSFVLSTLLTIVNCGLAPYKVRFDQKLGFIQKLEIEKTKLNLKSVLKVDII